MASNYDVVWLTTLRVTGAVRMNELVGIFQVPRRAYPVWVRRAKNCEPWSDEVEGQPHEGVYLLTLYVVTSEMNSAVVTAHVSALRLKPSMKGIM